MCYIVKGKKYAYDRTASVGDVIKHTFKENGQAIALCYKDTHITYRDLFRRIRGVADQLKRKGVTDGDRVALYSMQSQETVMVALAILFVGACYVPIEKSYPRERVQYIAQDCLPHLFIHDDEQCTLKLNANTVPVQIQEICSHHIDTPDDSFREFPAVSGEQLAYIIYTSGSTGHPKGIAVSHRSVNNHMLWLRKEFNLCQNDRFLLKTPLSFDPSIWELLIAFYVGGTLIISDNRRGLLSHRILDEVDTQAVTVLQMVPSLLHQLLLQKTHKQLDSLRVLFVGGDSLSVCTKKLFFEKMPHCQLVNLYGPAEATIDSTFYVVENTENTLSRDIIGYPIFNTSLYVVNDQSKLCGIGEIGELWVGGEGVSKGYVNHDEKTQPSFMISPFDHKTRIYKTGDWVRWNENRLLEYCGREDTQVKINGVRIDTNALKETITHLPGIYDCHFRRHRNSHHQYYALHCYLIPEKKASVCIDAIKNHLMRFFPSDMIPSRFFVVKDFDVSCNGKIVLPRWIDEGSRGHLTTNGGMNETERKILSLWNHILDIRLTQLDVDFYDVGGNSINSCILSAEMEKRFHVKMDFQELIKYRTVRQQAQYIVKDRKNMRITFMSGLNESAATTIFVVHPIGGTSFWFLPLAKLLNRTIQLYAISDPEMYDATIRLNSIVDMAEYYSECILAVKPSGPYLIGGASFGATVAVEIARILDKQGHDIDRILIFDGWAIYPHHLLDQEYFNRSMLRQQQEWKTKFHCHDVLNNRTINMFDVQRKRLRMLFSYAMDPIPYPVVLFKANTTLDIFQSVDDPTNHWGSYAKNIRVHRIEGDHETLFLNPGAAEIARYLLSDNNRAIGIENNSQRHKESGLPNVIDG